MSEVQSYLDYQAPRIFTIASGENFQTILAKGILAAIADDPDPFALHDTIVLAPTRRSVRTLSEAFLQVMGQKTVTLLPQILAIGDVDADEPPFIAGHSILNLAPEISTSNRLFSLARIILYRAKASGQELPLSTALAEASAIARLLDSAAYEGVTDFSLASEEFESFLLNQPEHIQRAARFLSIISTYWPQELAAQQLIDPATRRSNLLQSLCEQWIKNPTHKRVIVAGSTGSQRATANLLSVVSTLPNGCVVLPGFDQELDDLAWQQVIQAPGHPQYGMAQLLSRLKNKREQVQLWPQSSINLQQSRRRRIINEALTPADITSDWLQRLERLGEKHQMPVAGLMKNALNGLSLIEAETEDEEALAIALAIRETLETSDKTAMLVTPDRALARRVRAALQRWSVEVDDSAGIALPEDKLGIFFKLVLNWWEDPGDPKALLALLNHPLACLGHSREYLLKQVRSLDIGLLRGVRKYNGLDQLILYIEESKLPNKDKISALISHLNNITQKPKARAETSIADFATQHAKLAESLAATDTKSGAQCLWAGNSGELSSQLFRDLIADGTQIGNTVFEEYKRVFDFFSQQVSVRPRRPKGGRVRILGPLEARQQTADLIVLGALDEGVWPSNSNTDPFLPRSLIRKMKLPDPERRLGLSAHDFAELACKAEVILTRATRRDGTPTIASRWVWRLKTLIDAAIGKQKRQDLLCPKPDILAIARKLAYIKKSHPVCEPLPRPPITARPTDLFVTRIKTLIRNPFAIYGQKILRLNPLDPVGGPAGGRERGNAIHNALQKWHENTPSATPSDLSKLIIEFLLKAGFQPSELAVEAPAARRIAEAYLKWAEIRKHNGFIPRAFEKTGTLEFNLKSGDLITVSAKCDRIDKIGNDWTVLDYKTGAAPSSREVIAGFDPQLPLTGAIIHDGGFESANIKAAPIAELGYLKLSGGKKPLTFTIIKPKKEDAITTTQELVEEGLLLVKELFETFNDPKTAYRCQPRAKYMDDFSNFDHLARRAEWSAILDENES